MHGAHCDLTLAAAAAARLWLRTSSSNNPSASALLRGTVEVTFQMCWINMSSFLPRPLPPAVLIGQSISGFNGLIPFRPELLQKRTLIYN